MRQSRTSLVPTLATPNGATRVGRWLVTWLSVVALAGCAGGAGFNTRPTRSALGVYLRQIEPIRLAVNRLLSQADPVLRAYHDGLASPAEAARRMDLLERRFAAYAVEAAAIEPAAPELRVLHAAYAGTYVLEDAYLSALAAGLGRRELGNLPNTQAAQRAAIIRWRIGLMVLASREGVALPVDLQQAGRGEIAPAPGGS